MVRLALTMNAGNIPFGQVEEIWRSLWFSRFGPNKLRLRFELGGDGLNNTTQQVPRFLQAHGRACTIADFLFSEICVGVVAWHPQSKQSTIGAPRVRTGFQALEATGFRAKQIASWQANLYPDLEEEQGDWMVRCYELGGNKVSRDTLLWHDVALEMPIYPSACITSVLIDPSQKLMMHVYDDRGMYLIAADARTLEPTYRRFRDWLLGYDRERMAKLF